MKLGFSIENPALLAKRHSNQQNLLLEQFFKQLKGRWHSIYRDPRIEEM
ncbi:hypothetical protein [Gracilibacillus alcaliphilus]|nr:hypothetical protein [Gracilibacillus alcaliphilus]MBM7676757.1 hypothetical protein [Gracilibacillus alcaliphilus]